MRAFGETALGEIPNKRGETRLVIVTHNCSYFFLRCEGYKPYSGITEYAELKGLHGEGPEWTLLAAAPGLGS